MSKGNISLVEVITDLKHLSSELRSLGQYSTFGDAAYIGLNFIGYEVFVKVGQDHDPVEPLRIEAKAVEFDWPEVRAKIDAWLTTARQHRPFTHDEVGRTLGIIADEPTAAAA